MNDTVRFGIGLVGVLGAVGVVAYVIAYAAGSGYFKAKFEHNRKVINHLKHDAHGDAPDDREDPHE
jgi:hypothetical protein